MRVFYLNSMTRSRIARERRALFSAGLLFVCVLCFGMVSGAQAADEDPPAPAVDTPLNAQTNLPAPAMDAPQEAVKEEQPIDYTADKISYDQKKNILHGEGHVLIGFKNMSLKADRVIGYLETSDVYADGNVVLSIGNQVFTGEKVHFNFKTRLGDFINGTGYSDPWYGKGKMIRKTGSNEFQITEGYITSCYNENPHYKIKAKKIFIYPRERVIAKDVVFNVGGYDVFWSPIFTRSLKDEREHFTFIPGYNKRFGAFIRAAYNFWFDPYLDGSVHADYYAKRGPATGVDFNYRMDWKDKKDKDAPSLPMGGMFKSYILKDKNYQPVQGTGPGGKKTRYRISLKHDQQLFPDTRLLSEVHALSDPDIIDDFFRDEFEQNVQPQSFLDISKNTENYRLALFARKRINSMFNVLERLPEVQFQTRTLPMGKTGFYYTTTNSMGYLRQKLTSGNDYDSLRADTNHEFHYPFKAWRWLNLDPRVGFEDTFYTKGVNRNGIFRNLVFTGIDIFTKLHKLYPKVESDFWDLHQVRHVVEPRITFTFVPVPSYKPSELLQFDEIDTRTKQDNFRLGLRQLLQTRRMEETINVIDADIATYYYPNSRVPFLDRLGKEHKFSYIYLESRFRPLSWVAIDLKGGYDQYNKEINQLLLDLAFIHGDDWNISFRQRQVQGESNLTACEVVYRLNQDWIAKGFWRYDFKMNRLEAQEYTLLRDLHCWEVAFTFRQRQLRNDMSMFVVFRMKDYPQMPIKFGN